jgi:hypothetical protein
VRLRVRHHRIWVAAPVIALAALAGCSNNTTVPSVIVVGDSMTSVDQAQLQAALDSPYAPTFVVRSSGGIDTMSALLGATIRSDGNPGVVVTNLGTTDALRAGTAVTTGSPLAPLVSAMAGVACVVLTTVNVRTDRRGALRQLVTQAARINHQIKALARSDPTKYKVVDWNEFLVTLPAASVPTYLQANGYLETATGGAWLARADLAGVRACGSTHQPTVIGPNRI